jgi:hypothetical protein
MNTNPTLLIRITHNKKAVHIFFIFLALLLTYHYTHFRFSFNSEHPYATRNALLNGTAVLPFQYRALIPWLIRGLSFLLPGSSFMYFKAIEFFSVFFLVIVFRTYLSLFLTGQKLLWLSSLSLFYVLPFNYLYQHDRWYPYDMPAILFFAIGMLLMYQKKWVWYILLFVVATLNRETSCFLIFIFIISTINKKNLPFTLIFAFTQCTIWLAIKYVMFTLYGNNGGTGLFETNLVSNVKFLLNFREYPLLFSCFGYVWIPVLFFFQRINNTFIKRSLFVIFPFFCGMLIVGRINEIRIFGELIPLVLSSFLVIAYSIVKEERPEYKNR